MICHSMGVRKCLSNPIALSKSSYATVINAVVFILTGCLVCGLLKQKSAHGSFQLVIQIKIEIMSAVSEPENPVDGIASTSLQGTNSSQDVDKVISVFSLDSAKCISWVCCRKVEQP